MKKLITGTEYSKLPVYAHSLYEFKGIDNYVLLENIDYTNFVSMMYYHAKGLSFVDFNDWFRCNSPIRVCDNLEILLLLP